MWGEDTIFERQMRDFETIEKDPNKNVDEQEKVKEQKEIPVGFDIYGNQITKGDKVSTSDANPIQGTVDAVWDDGSVDIEYTSGPGGPLADTFDIKGHGVQKMSADESKTNEEEERTTDLPVGAEPDKPELSEPNPPKEVLQDLCAAWELIGSIDDDPHVRTMADEKADELHRAITAGEGEPGYKGGGPFNAPKERDGIRRRESKTDEEVKEEVKVEESFEKATDGELKAAMTALAKLHSAAVAKTMDTIQDEISRRSREYDRQMGAND